MRKIVQGHLSALQVGYKQARALPTAFLTKRRIKKTLVLLAQPSGMPEPSGMISLSSNPGKSSTSNRRSDPIGNARGVL